MAARIPILRVNRLWPSEDHPFEIEVSESRLRLTVFTEKRPLKARCSEYHLEIEADGLTLFLSTPKQVVPDSMQLRYFPERLQLEVELHPAAAHPRPVWSAAHRESCPCVEHPRTRDGGSTP